jgi:hypothetical protein
MTHECLEYGFVTKPDSTSNIGVQTESNPIPKVASLGPLSLSAEVLVTQTKVCACVLCARSALSERAKNEYLKTADAITTVFNLQSIPHLESLPYYSGPARLHLRFNGLKLNSVSAG